MAWLWLVSVGVTDVQFPAWKQDQFGQWSQRRVELGRGGCREVHQNLLALLNQDLIAFPDGLPAAIPREDARDLRLELEEDQGSFLVSLKAPSTQATQYRISSHGNEIPNEREPRLPLYCPKAGELLGVARETFGADPVTLVVLNTRRNPSLPDGRDEPIASGPLVTKFLAERLGLDWVDGRGAIPDAITAGVATWVDILTGDEAMEDPDAQGKVVRRITNLIRCWMTGGERKIAVTTSGGMPPLKPIIERVPATCLGQEAIKLLDRPERGPAKVTALNYNARVAEREILRFHCVEALRQGDYASAYGLARRALGQPWALSVQDGLGALLELPGASLRPNGSAMPQSALTACRIEIRLCLGDAIGALIRLGTFIESSIWELIPRDSRIHRLGLIVDRDEECLVGYLPRGHPLVNKGMIERDAKGQDRHRVLDTTWRWPNWLRDPLGRQQRPVQALDDFNRRYGDKARLLRNRLIHGTEVPIDPRAVQDSMINTQLIRGLGLPFGQNFLGIPDVQRLLNHLDPAHLTKAVRGHLIAVLHVATEG